MRQLYLIATLLFTSSSLFAQLGQIQNGGFENWTNSTLYEYPTQWGNSNSDEWRGAPTVLKSTDASGGTYSCEITAVQVGPDTLFGYVYHGGVGQSGPESGIAYTDVFNEVRFQYKSDIQVDDTLYMIYMRFASSVMIEMNALPAAYGTQSTWTQGSIALPSTPQDELFIGFVMGDPFNNVRPKPGSWVKLDDVQLFNTGIATTAIPDPGFEQWSTQTIETPDNWFTLDEMLAGEGIENAIKSLDANSGTYAVEMTTVQNMYGDTIPSFISWGPIDFNAMGNPFLPSPYNATPTTFSGAYKYSPQNGDQANIQILFLQAGTPVGSHFETFNAAATYQTFTSPLTIGGTPDSIVFVAFSGDNPGSVLKLDDLSFSGGDVSLEEFEKMSVSLYPNPAKDVVMIQAEGDYNVIILDLAGNVVIKHEQMNGAQELNINSLSKGAYLVQITNSVKIETLRLIKE